MILKQLNMAMDYIEDHLEETITLEEIAQHINVSDSHFRKIFFALTNITLSEYIKNRRLSEANKALLKGEKVTETAYKYGYQSIDGFSRAFKKWSGIYPSEVNKLQQSKLCPKLNFIITVKGGNSMEYKIIKKEAFYFAGVSKRVSLQFEGVNNEIVELAQSITEKQQKELHRLKNIEPHEIVNVSYDSDTGFLEEKGQLTHLIGILTTSEDISDQLDKVFMPASLWAVFPNDGPFPFTLQDTMARIYSEWLVTSDYELATSLSFSFTKMNEYKQGHAYSEIWIPVIPKKEC